MKKIITLIMVIMFIFNTLVMAQPRPVDAQPVLYDDSDDAELELNDDIEKEARSQETIPMCVKYLKGKFPNASLQRLNSVCSKLKNREEVIKKVTMVREVFNERLLKLSEAQRERLQKLNEEQKSKLEKLNEEHMEKLSNLREEQLKKLTIMNRQQIKNLAQKSEVEIDKVMDRYKIKTFGNKADMFRKRTVENYKEAKEKYENYKDIYNEIKDLLKEKRQAFKLAVDNEDEEAALVAAKDYLTTTADLVIKGLEKIQAEVESNDDLTDEEANEIITDLDTKISEMNDAKSEVDAAQNKEEVKAAGKKILNAWNRMQSKVRLHAFKVIHSRVQDVLKRSEYMVNKLEKALTKLEEKGYDISEISDLKDDFDAKIENAKENFGNSKEKYKDAMALKDDDEATRKEITDLIHEANALLKDAHDDLKEAHKISVEILKAIRDKAGSLESVEEESEDDYIIIEENECSIDLDCDSDEMCLDGDCKEVEDDDDDQCTIDADCEDDKVCLGGDCKEIEDDDQCTIDADCEDDKVCLDGDCKEVEEDDQCTIDADCEDDKVCLDGDCKKIEDDNECDVDSDCGEIQTCPDNSTYYTIGCNEGVCEEKIYIDDPCFDGTVECVTEQDCIDSGECNEALECTCYENECYTGLIDTTNDCDIDDDCENDLYCNDGVCEIVDAPTV